MWGAMSLLGRFFGTAVLLLPLPRCLLSCSPPSFAYSKGQEHREPKQDRSSSSSAGLLHHLERLFVLLDSNSDGAVSMEDIKAHLRKLALLPASTATAQEEEEEEEHCTEALEHLVASSSSSSSPVKACLSLSEFQSLFHTTLTPQGEGERDGALREAFRVFDVDGDGVIRAWELERVLGRMGLLLLPHSASCDRMLRQFASNNRDALLDFPDFCAMMRDAL